MKTFFRIAAAAALFAAMTACDAFHSLTKSRLKTAQGAPYELIVVCPQQEWTGEVGDTLRAIFTAPIPYLNQTEPLFDVLRVTERGIHGHGRRPPQHPQGTSKTPRSPSPASPSSTT